MRRALGFPRSELTFGPVLASLLRVEPEPEVSGTGCDEDWVRGLVDRARAGDPEGYRQLFRLHVRRVHGLVRRLAGSHGDVDDLVQVVFTQAFQALPGFRGDSTFYTWLGRIAVRATLRHQHRSRPHPVSLDQVPDAPDERAQVSPERSSDARRALVRFDAILASLSEKRRAAFVLHVLQGHSLEEVAAMLEVRVGAVKVRIHDARVEIERLARRDPYLRHYLQWEPTP
jgi:RNA polymerase sigma-70 factor (ECF subfamily)